MEIIVSTLILGEPADSAYNLNTYLVPDNYNISLTYIDDTGKHTSNYTGAYDSQYTFLSVPSRTGYTFTGYTRNDGKEITTKSIIDIARDHSVVAGYKANKYTVTLDADGGEVSSNSKLVTYDANYGILPTPEKMGYIFEGWYLNDKKISSTDIVKKAGAHTLKAKYSAETVTVNLDPSEGDCDVTETKVTVGEAYGSLPTPVRFGYTFEGWYLDEDKIEETTILSDKYYSYHSYGKGLVAHWKLNEKENTGSTIDSEKSTDISSESTNQTASITMEKEFDLGKNGKSTGISSESTNQTASIEKEIDLGKITNDNSQVSQSTSSSIKPVLSNLKVKNISGRKLKISLYGKNVSGYQIQYSLYKDFSKGKTVNTKKQTYKTVKLKKKTYYIRARAYATAENGELVYSAWSTVGKKKIRK